LEMVRYAGGRGAGKQGQGRKGEEEEGSVRFEGPHVGHTAVLPLPAGWSGRVFERLSAARLFRRKTLVRRRRRRRIGNLVLMLSRLQWSNFFFSKVQWSNLELAKLFIGLRTS
jgi:hypothetical protein